VKSLIIGVSGVKQSGKDTVANFLCSYFNDCKIKVNSSLLAGLGWDFGQSRVYSFADPLKRFLIDVMGLREEQCYGSDEDKNSLTNYKWDNLPMVIRQLYSKEVISSVNELRTEFPMTYFADDICDWGEVVDAPRTGYMTSRELMQIFGTDMMRRMFDDRIWVNATLGKINKDLNEGKPLIAIINDVRFISEVISIMEQPNACIIRLLRKPHEDIHPSETELDGYNFSQYGYRGVVIDNESLGIDKTNDRILGALKSLV